MSLRVARGVFNPEKERFHYYVSFKPTLDPTEEKRAAGVRHKIDVAVSVTETGELADLPLHSLNPVATSNPCNTSPNRFASVVEDRVFVVVPGMNGDSVLEAHGIWKWTAQARSWAWKFPS